MIFLKAILVLAKDIFKVCLIVVSVVAMGTWLMSGFGLGLIAEFHESNNIIGIYAVIAFDIIFFGSLFKKNYYDKIRDKNQNI